MITKRKRQFGLLGRLPFIGSYIRKRMDVAFLLELQIIDARFGSPLVRFDTLIHELYDCLQALERPLDIDPNDFHGRTFVVHTRSSNAITQYLERVYDNEQLNIDSFFNLYHSPQEKEFLDWYSSTESVEQFINQMVGLLGIICRKYEVEGFIAKDIPENNTALELLTSSRWMKLLVRDLIQLLAAVLIQRTGG